MLLVSSVGDSVFQLVVVLVIFVIVLALTYYSTKWIAGYQKTAMRNKNLQIVETVRLPGNKYVQIIRAGKDKYFVVGVGKDEINCIGSLTADDMLEISEEDSTSQPSVDFKNILEKFQKNIPQK